MPAFVVTAVFVLESAPAGGKTPLGADVVALGLGPGHRFSYCDGRTLSVVLELTAAHEGAAFESVLSRVEQAWSDRGGAELSAPTTLRLQRMVPPEPVPAGRPGRAARTEAERTRMIERIRLDLLKGRGRRGLTGWDLGRRPPEDPGGNGDDFDDGGLAGVREPRRPGPGPGRLGAARPTPGPVLPESPLTSGPEFGPLA